MAPASARTIKPAGPDWSPSYSNKVATEGQGIRFELRFELARAEHADIVLDMMRALEGDDPGSTPFDEAQRRAIFERFVCDSTYGKAWLIVYDEKYVGYVVLTVSFSFEYRGYDAFIDELYIAEEHRRQGIGQRTMEFVEMAAAELGVNAIHLEVTHGNDPAIGLYRRAGYSSNERFLMTKWLNPGPKGS
jgi:ribosomal protein S18 acetylase RimI-like enzyme